MYMIRIRNEGNKAMTTMQIDFSKCASITELPKFDTGAFELNLSEDLWANDDEPKIDAGLMKLQAKHFTKWLRKQIRQYGRRVEVGTEEQCPVEAWLAELGFSCKFIAGGEVELADGTLLT